MQFYMAEKKDMFMAAALSSINPKEMTEAVEKKFSRTETPEIKEFKPVERAPEHKIRKLFTRWIQHSSGKNAIKNPMFRDPEDGKDKYMKDMVLDAIKECDDKYITLKHAGKVSMEWLVNFINQKKPDFKKFWG